VTVRRPIFLPIHHYKDDQSPIASARNLRIRSLHASIGLPRKRAKLIVRVAPSKDRRLVYRAYASEHSCDGAARTLPHRTLSYDVITRGPYGTNGARHGSPHENSFGSLTYLVYVLTDRIGVGFIPIAGYSMLSGAPSISGPDLGDLTVSRHWISRRREVRQLALRGLSSRIQYDAQLGAGHGWYLPQHRKYACLWLLCAKSRARWRLSVTPDKHRVERCVWLSSRRRV
jgi:hypothetical protein